METTPLTSSELKKTAFTTSLTWSVINIAIFVIVYYVSPVFMGSITWGILQILINIGLAVVFCLDLRKKVGGYWSFREALSSIFILFIVQAIIVYFFTIIFGKYIEPSYVQKMTDIMINTMTSNAERMGVAQDQIDEMVRKTEISFKEQLNPGIRQILTGLTTIIIMYFIGSLIFAAIFKRDKPVFMPVTEE